MKEQKKKHPISGTSSSSPELETGTNVIATLGFAQDSSRDFQNSVTKQILEKGDQIHFKISINNQDRPDFQFFIKFITRVSLLNLIDL